MANQLKERVLAFYHRHEAYAPATFFILGFLFDVITLGQIDDTLTIVQQGTYLAVISAILVLEVFDRDRPLSFPETRLGRAFAKSWEYRELLVHFLFGSLLSAYTLFYFKSASFVTSFLFLILLAGVMVANESSRVQRLGSVMRFGLLSLCLVSYFGYVVPIFLGHIGVLPFALSVAISLVVLAGLFAIIKRRDLNPEAARLTLLSLRSAGGVQALFVILYALAIVPPVPLSALYMGIYHKVEKENGRYVLSYEHPPWRFWENGAQTFLARPGDRVYLFARIFSPTRFKDEIRVRWLYDDPKAGWQSSDAIPIQISGGRKEGFRGFAFKQNFTPGDWRVQLETTDGREIGRIGFTVVPLDESMYREFSIDTDP